MGIHEGLDLDGQLLDRSDIADRQLGRQHAAVARGHHPVACGDLDPRAQELDARPLAVVAGQDRALALRPDHDRYAAVQVGDQQDAGRAYADIGDPADQANPGERGLAPAQAVAAAGVDHHRAHEGPPGIGHHPGRDAGLQRIGHHVQEIAQRLVLGLQAAGRHLPMHQALVPCPELGVLGSQGGQFLGPLDGLADGGDRPRGGVEDRRDGIDHGHAGPVERDAVHLGEQHQREGDASQP